ncbi:MAG: type II secretion system GspH family protein [Gammaproteobacteria bacterium]|nr:type II secretion system GspH family protein [Gammaproteobacteria bacterium]
MIAKRGSAGFSLIELAIVMVIIAFLVSGAILPLSSTIDRARIKEARVELDERIRSALLGYAASRPLGTVFMPCPDCRAACGGALPNDGIEDRDGGGLCAVDVGNLPWVTLGLGEADPWGSRYGYGVTPDFADSANGFTLTAPDLTAAGVGASVQDGAGNFLVGSAGTEGTVVIVWSAGKNRYGAVSEQGVVQSAPPAANADEVENANGDALFISRPVDLQGGAEQFDDILIWLSGPEVRGFMVQAGRLP